MILLSSVLKSSAKVLIGCVGNSCPQKSSISKGNNGSRILVPAKPFPWQPITRAIFGQYYFSGATSCISHPSAAIAVVVIVVIIVVVLILVLVLCARRSTEKIDLPIKLGNRR